MIGRNLSPLRYPGGKVVLADLLENVIYSNKVQGGTYIEPFAGGAGAGLKLLADGHVDRIVINDADKAIFAFWRSVMSNSEEMIERTLKVPLTIDEWRKQRDIYIKPSGRSRIDLGFATFFLNRCNRSGIIKDGGPIGGLEQSGTWKINARFNRENLAERIEEISSYADRILVLNEDANSLIGSLNSKFPSERLFIYADPPYYVKGGDLYLSYYLDADHAQLAKTCSSQTSIAWLVTYDDVARIRELYSQHRLLSFSLRYSAHSASQEGGELLIAPEHLRLPRNARTMLKNLRVKRSK